MRFSCNKGIKLREEREQKEEMKRDESDRNIVFVEKPVQSRQDERKAEKTKTGSNVEGKIVKENMERTR